MVILLSNLLDNAIEACEKLDCNKVIRLKLVKEKQQMVLSVQNPVAVPVEIKNNDIQTGKGDKKNHGIGLKNIQMVLDKYGGIGRIRKYRVIFLRLKNGSTDLCRQFAVQH